MYSIDPRPSYSTAHLHVTSGPRLLHVLHVLHVLHGPLVSPRALAVLHVALHCACAVQASLLVGGARRAGGGQQRVITWTLCVSIQASHVSHRGLISDVTRNPSVFSRPILNSDKRLKASKLKVTLVCRVVQNFKNISPFEFECKTFKVRNDRKIKIARWSGCESVLRCRINSILAILTRFLLNRNSVYTIWIKDEEKLLFLGCVKDIVCCRSLPLHTEIYFPVNPVVISSRLTSYRQEGRNCSRGYPGLLFCSLCGG